AYHLTVRGYPELIRIAQLLLILWNGHTESDMAKALRYRLDRRLVHRRRRRRGSRAFGSGVNGITTGLRNAYLQRLVPWIAQARKVNTRFFEHSEELCFRRRIPVRANEASVQRPADRLIRTEEPVPFKPC